MKQHYFLFILSFFLISGTFIACGSDDNGTYTEVPTPEPEPEPEPVSPVVLDLNAVPYANLSTYKFYDGPMKDLVPAYKVIPYDLNSTLFTDYAHKKRFIWMPEGVQATYEGDGTLINFPTGTVLIKNFYYDNVQPSNTTRILETRLMIRKADGWIFANYIWNDQQTEAILDMNGAYVDISWTENGTTMNTNYRIPSEVECLTCHKTGDTPAPIGPKPQNLNKNFTYAGGAQNQLSKWIQEGYLANSLPQNIVSTVDWTDESKPLDLRVRSYLDINCAHCHAESGHCDYRPIRLAFHETESEVNQGVCVEAQQTFNSTQRFIVAKGSALRSVMHYRMNTNDEAARMPLMGRTVIHTEAIQMIEQWINSMDTPCPN